MWWRGSDNTQIILKRENFKYFRFLIQENWENDDDTTHREVNEIKTRLM